MEFDEYVELIMAKTTTNDFLIKAFREELKDRVDGHKNSLPLVALYQDRYALLASFLLRGIFNLNVVNMAGETLLTICLKKGKPQLAIEIIDAGYSNFDITINGLSIFDYCALDKKFYPVLTRIMAVDETENEAPPVEFKLYEPNFFQMGNEKGSGGYGIVKMAIGKDNKCYALKSSKYSPKVLSEDSIREIEITKVLNRLYPKATCYIYGIYKDSNGVVYVVTEYLKHTLSSIFEIYKNVPNEIKKGFYMRIFKNLTETLNMVNKCGICHFDLKPANIMLDSKGYIRIIDFGISEYLGLGRDLIKHYLETWTVKAPDDVIEQFSYEINTTPVFLKNNQMSYRVDYSSDMFAIATMILGSILSQQTLQLVITKTVSYIFYRGNGYDIEVRVLNDFEKEKIDEFSPYLWDFFIRVFTVNSGIRLTCKEALEHPFFSGVEPKYNLVIPYSISDVDVPQYIQKFSYTHFEISNRLHELKYLQEIIDTYIPFIIPATDSNLSEILFEKWDDVEYQLITQGYDEYINAMMFAHEFKSLKGIDLSKDDMKNVVIIFRTAMHNGYYTYREDDIDLVNAILQSQLHLIPFNSLIVGITTLCRENGDNCVYLSTFFKRSYEWLYKFIASKRNLPIGMGDLIDTFMAIASNEPISVEFEWVAKIINE